MLNKLKNLERNFNLEPSGVLHLGAHHAEENQEYIEMNWGPVIWVEAIPSLAKELKFKLDPTRNQVHQAVVWSESNIEVEFKVASQTMASSIFDFGTHAKLYPNIEAVEVLKLKTTKLIDLLDPSDVIDLMVLDIQGAEIQALQGLGKRIREVKWIYTEVSKVNLYEGGSKLDDLDMFLKINGFTRRSTRILKGENWGEALYVTDQLWPQIGRVNKVRATSDDLIFIVKQVIYLARYTTSKWVRRVTTWKV